MQASNVHNGNGAHNAMFIIMVANGCTADLSVNLKHAQLWCTFHWPYRTAPID